MSPFLLVLLLVAGPSELGLGPELIAPSFEDARVAVEKLERLVTSADAVAVGLFRSHNRFAQRRQVETKRPRCDDRWAVDLTSRARVLGTALRDVAQAARAQAHRVERLLVAPTVRPLVDARMEFRALGLLDRVELLGRRYDESAAWHKRYLEESMRRCPTDLRPAPGLAGGALPAEGEEAPAAVAVILAPAPPIDADGDAVDVSVGGEAEWRVCPPGAVFGPVVVVEGGKACYGNAACNCETTMVLPAAVLGASGSTAAGDGVESGDDSAGAGASGDAVEIGEPENLGNAGSAN